MKNKRIAQKYGQWKIPFYNLLQSFPPKKGLIFQLFPRVVILMSEDAGIVFMIMVACLALEAIMKDQVEQFNTIGVAATAMGIN